MGEHLDQGSQRDEIKDEFPNGALFEINTDTEDGEHPKELVIVPLGASAVKHRFLDVRMAAANDNTSTGLEE